MLLLPPKPKTNLSEDQLAEIAKRVPPGKDGAAPSDDTLRGLIAKVLEESKAWITDTLDELVNKRMPSIVDAILLRVPVPKDGADGKHGRDGRDGVDGRDGAKGDKGERGPAGRSVKGPQGDKGDKGDSIALDATFITFEDEQGELPKSRKLEAGPNIYIDRTSHKDKIIISASGGGGGAIIQGNSEGGGVRYLIQTEQSKYWTDEQFLRGTNIIGVRYNAPAQVYLPHGLAIEKIITVKDELGEGVTVYAY